MYTDDTHSATFVVERGQYFANAGSIVRVERVSRCTVTVRSALFFRMRVSRGTFLYLYKRVPAPLKPIYIAGQEPK
jgi:hypothetical protein